MTAVSRTKQVGARYDIYDKVGDNGARSHL
jgi:hypothetical protein